jgi:hypothetical protein
MTNIGIEQENSCHRAHLRKLRILPTIMLAEVRFEMLNGMLSGALRDLLERKCGVS